MADPLIRHVADTAFMVAHHRAVESDRPDALFRDPLAGRLAGDKGRAVAEASPTAAMTGWIVAIRTVIIDDLIRAAIERGVDLVLNVGAGLDTRPYRMELPPGLTWVEVDFPEVIAFKEERLRDETPRCRLERVGLDLAQAAGRRALFERIDGQATRILVLTEGVVPYLDEAAAGTLADDLHGLRHLDGWIVDYVSPESRAYRRRAGVERHMKNAPFKFQPADWFAFFEQHRFGAQEVRYIPVEAYRLGRFPPLPWKVRLLIKLLGPFGLRARRERFRKSTGYVLLTPMPHG